jgi:hypothetical protein
MFRLGVTVCSVVVWSASNVSVRYHFTTETSYEDVTLTADTLRVTRFVDSTHRCATWLEQRPCWTQRELRASIRMLSRSDILGLEKLIRTSGFLRMQDTIGATTAGARYYAEELSVSAGGATKSVVYRSAPGVSPRLVAFRVVRDRILSLARPR